MAKVRRPNLRGAVRKGRDAARRGGEVADKLGHGGRAAGKRAVALAKAATETERDPTGFDDEAPDLRLAMGPVLDSNMDGVDDIPAVTSPVIIGFDDEAPQLLATSPSPNPSTAPSRRLRPSKRALRTNPNYKAPARGPTSVRERLQARVISNRLPPARPKGRRPHWVSCRKCGKSTKAWDRICAKCSLRTWRPPRYCICGSQLPRGHAQRCAPCRAEAASKHRETRALRQREYRARNYAKERLREKRVDYARAVPLEWHRPVSSDTTIALFAGDHQTPFSVETPDDGSTWVVCRQGWPEPGHVYGDGSEAMDATEELYRPYPVKEESSPAPSNSLSGQL